MKIVAKDARGQQYTYTGRWETEGEDPLSQTILNGLRQYDRLGKKAFPHLKGWSQALPPHRRFEDNQLIAKDAGLHLVLAQAPDAEEQDY